MTARTRTAAIVAVFLLSVGIATMALGQGHPRPRLAASGRPGSTTTPTVPPSTTTTEIPTTTTTTLAPPPPPTTVPFGPWQPLAKVPGLYQLITPVGSVLRIDPHQFDVALVPGTAEPGGTFPEGGQIPAARRPALVAAMNAGFKRRDARGGETVDGRTVGTLATGAASLVIHADGTIDVGAWGGTVGPRPDDIVVLQNLSLLVDHGQPAADLGTNVPQRWGFPFRAPAPYRVWRSGAGVDDQGRLLWAAGPNLVPADLAGLLVTGGAVRAMELDINNGLVFAGLFSHPDPQHPDQVQGTLLMSTMQPSPTKVLSPGRRDFLAVYRR